MSDESIQCWYIGSERVIQFILLYLEEHPHVQAADLKKAFSCLYGNFAFIIQQESRIIAAVDRIRSYPVFYTYDGSRFQVSNSARTLKEENRLDEIDSLSILEFRMAGYVTGSGTVLSKVRQLKAGEMLLWDGKSNRIDLARHFCFLPDKVGQETFQDDDDRIDALKQHTDQIFERVVENAAGRPIWVPLSGGLDSRLVLCMLARKQYDNLHAFSYGVPRNHEARIARIVAGKIGVPWTFVPIGRRAFRRFYRSAQRRDYWAYCDFLSSVPNMQDLLPLREMLADGTLSGNAVMVNGQSGDFITGGHIPDLLPEKDKNWECIFEALVEKHFSQWSESLTHGNLKRIEEKLLNLLSEVSPDPKESEDKFALYEYWEWQERQCKYVVNGQRVYDWLGLDWELPLWDSEYLDFWRNVPSDAKKGQRIYLDFLMRWNPYGLFKQFQATVWRWPGPMIAVVPLARIAGLLAGIRMKNFLYRMATFWGHYGYYYAAVGMYRFLRHSKTARGGVSYFIDDWLRENFPAVTV